jgi:UDP-N-acetyl-D-glucosamine dehydrogenase
MKNKLNQKLKDHSGIVGIVGMGYVGLPLALAFTEAGFKVIGFEVDKSKVKSLKDGENYLRHLDSNRIKTAVNSKKLEATTDMALASECDALIICVPTPLDVHHSPDMSFVCDTLDVLTPHLRAGQILSLESTVYPGATQEEVNSRVEKRGLKVGEDVFVVFSPEREDPGNGKFHTANIPKVVGGSTPACLEMGVLLYSQVIQKVVPVTSTQAAEMTKLLENIYRAVNIGLVNELKMVADQMGINIWEVIDAAATKPFGFTPFYPGPGLGGHCIPIDPFYLTWKAKEYGIHTRFIELAGQVNWAMPEWVIEKVTDALNNQSKALKGSKILVLGVAYKKNIDDMRESPSLELMKLLELKGAEIHYADPFVPLLNHEHKNKVEAIEATAENVSKMDCILVATDHDSFDYEMIQKNAQLIVDTRGRYRKSFSNVVRA